MVRNLAKNGDALPMFAPQKILNPSKNTSGGQNGSTGTFWKTSFYGEKRSKLSIFADYAGFLSLKYFLL